MFKRITFDVEALDDIKALVSLNESQLTLLSQLIDSPDAALPADKGLVIKVQQVLGTTEAIADAATRVCVVLQDMNLEASDASEVVEDFEELIRQSNEDDQAGLLSQIANKREALKSLVIRKPRVTRKLRLGRIAKGTHPAIVGIRSVVQLSPLFERDKTKTAVGIECLVPVMTLEIQSLQEDIGTSDTFSLTEETLEKLIKSLQDTKEKWRLLTTTFSDRICK